MALNSDTAILRPVGKLEQFSTARHDLGFYRCVANTARYTTTCNPAEIPTIIEAAVAQVVLQHPALCCGIIHENSANPSFVQLKAIDLSIQIVHRTLDTPTSSEYEAHLLKVIEHQHRQLWPSLEKLPAWKLIIVSQQLFTTKSFDAIFAFHHAPIDGISGAVFHRALLGALQTPKPIPEKVEHILTVPASIPLAPALEKAVQFKLSWYFFLTTLWKEFGPKLYAQTQSWTAGVCNVDRVEDYRSRVKAIIISSNDVANILASCRKEKTTLTGLLHGFVVVSLALNVKVATSFTGSTPYSLRHLSGLHPTKEMGNNVSGFDSHYSENTIASIRHAQEVSDLTNCVWNIARDFRKSLQIEMSNLPNDNIIGMLPYVSDVHKIFTSKLGKPRAVTFEISNIGNLENSSDKEWAINRILFTQSGSLTGPAVTFSVASVAGGDLSVGVTWLEGDIEESVVDALTHDVERFLKKIAAGQELEI